MGCACGDRGISLRTQFRHSPACVVADHHRDTIVAKGQRQHWMYVWTRSLHDAQWEMKGMTCIGCESGQAWHCRGLKLLWKAKGDILKFPVDHFKEKPLNHDVSL